MEYNLADLFESVVDVVPDREALVYIDHPGTGAERRLTYAELDAAANRVAHHLIGAGIEPGEHLGLHLYNGIEYLQTVLGCLKARVVPVNVNYRYVEEELVYLYRDADLAALVFDAEFTRRVAAALPKTQKLRHLVRVGTPPQDAPPLDAVSFADATAGASPGRGFGQRSADDQFIIYTGGTTGMPKGVMWRQEDLFFSGLGGGAPTGEPVSFPEELAERVAAGGDGITFFPTPPLMHGTSTLTAFIGFNFGQRIVVHRKYVPEEVLRTIEKEKVTSVSLVGDAMLRPLIDALNGPLKGTDLSALFSVSSSGAIMSETVRAQFSALAPNVMLLNNFGSSESGFNGTATEDSGPEKGFRLRVNSRTEVVDPATYEPVAVGEPGRIAQRGHVPSATTTTPRRPRRPSSSAATSDGCCSATWRRSTRKASSPSSAAARSASTPVARRCIRKRSSRRSSPTPMCTTRWWPGCRTPRGATMWPRWCRCARGRRSPVWRRSSRTAAPGWPATRFRASW